MDRDVFRVVAADIGGRLFVALWGGLGVACLARIFPSEHLVATVLVLGVVGGCAVGLPAFYAAAVAATGWLVLDGFVAHSYGELAFGAGDLWRIVLVFVVVASAATMSPSERRTGGARR